MKRFIILDASNTVISVRYGTEVVTGEIESTIGDCGQVMQQDGSFTTPEQPSVETTEDKLTLIQENQLILMDAIATLYEDLILGASA